MSDFLGDVLTPLDYVVSAPLVAWHEVFATALDVAPGWAWALAIVGMTVTIRVLMMPFHVSQLRMRRELRRLEPQIQALEETYGHDRELLAQEQIKLVKTVGLKPIVSLVPLVLLGLVLLVLARMIHASKEDEPRVGSFRRGFLTDGDARSLARAEIAGGRIADTLIDSAQSQTTVVAAVLIAVICVAHLVAQRQEAALLPARVVPSGVIEQRPQVLAHVLLVGMAAISLVLAVGVLIFWATSKLCTVAQQRFLREGPGPAIDPSPQPT